ncbi:ACP S-malonyltransferase [Vibrio sp. S4M6]|uniref:ACP S-malonyltransferase n=1 Tax=Vibrio sinus TaxID=2946865 RepID=UPI002029C86B|nr:ACP S-malonyltransferase [Vibrio sinus]MCL9781792.1 ACP S-malonyltransferase [Vibrio sinus]
MTKAIVFPGQGSQVLGMGRELFELFPELIKSADSILGYSIVDLCLRDQDGLLNKTEYTQPALYVVNILNYLRKCRLQGEDELVTYLAGHSLGEYCALFAAGAFDFDVGLRLVQRRGALMSQAPKGGMAAVLGLSVDAIKDILSQNQIDSIDLANINSSEQIILSGLKDDIESPLINRLFTAAGASYFPLNVSAAFHSRYMKGVEKTFADFLASFELRPLQKKVVANVTARPYPQQGYADLLCKQISSPVKWYESLSWMLKQGVNKYEEMGPGTVLTKLTDHILKSPLQIKETPVKDSRTPDLHQSQRPQNLPIERGIVFMFGGQGMQYFQMGNELYQKNEVFRRQMVACDALVRSEMGYSVIDVIYNPSSTMDESFDNILHTHPALFCVGYSLHAMMQSLGVHPDSILGYSLGEFVGLVVSGCLSWQEGLMATIRQAQLLVERAPDGGMMSILTPVSHYEQRPDLYGRAEVAGVNFSDNFCISGTTDELQWVKQNLDREGITSLMLPVRYPFHSSQMEQLKPKWHTIFDGITASAPRIPCFSSAHRRAVTAEDMQDITSFAWNIMRQSVSFYQSINQNFSDSADITYIDLSPSGTLNNFIKYSNKKHSHSCATINPYGRDVASVEKVVSSLANLVATKPDPAVL